MVVSTAHNAISDASSIKSAVSIESIIKKDITIPRIFPEVAHVAEVRRSLDNCHEEKEYLHARKLHVRDHFVTYLGFNPAEVHPDDVPTVALGSSGGGYRAMLGLLGYCDEMNNNGLWDLLTYIAGVSGSCWSLAAYYTIGDADVSKARTLPLCDKPH